MRIEKVAIVDLVLRKRNARSHGEESVAAIEASLREFGQQKPITITRKGTVLKGEGTVLAAKRLGWRKLLAQRTKLAGKQAAAYAIADNRTAELSRWNYKRLHALVAEMDGELNIDDLNLGFEPWEIRAQDSEPTLDERELVDGSAERTAESEAGGAPAVEADREAEIVKLIFVCTREQHERLIELLTEAMDHTGTDTHSDAVIAAAEGFRDEGLCRATDG